MLQQRNTIVGLGMMVLSSVAACQGPPEGTGDETVALEEIQNAATSSTSVPVKLAPCQPDLGGGTIGPPLNTGSACTLANGDVKFQITLPIGQQYVEVFARQNGIQNVAQDITATAIGNRGGTSATYSFIKTYQAKDLVEFRFYSYLPNSPGVFTPGPQENRWYTFRR
jgi:hypothetical protein